MHWLQHTMVRRIVEAAGQTFMERVGSRAKAGFLCVLFWFKYLFWFILLLSKVISPILHNEVRKKVCAAELRLNTNLQEASLAGDCRSWRHRTTWRTVSVLSSARWWTEVPAASAAAHRTDRECRTAGHWYSPPGWSGSGSAIPWCDSDHSVLWHLQWLTPHKLPCSAIRGIILPIKSHEWWKKKFNPSSYYFTKRILKYV